MAYKDSIKWFKDTFGAEIESAVQGTPFDLNMLTAIAMQETHYVWGRIYKTQPLATVLEVCVGDVIDAPNRKAFPKNKSALLAEPKGDKMFEIARAALLQVANVAGVYKESAAKHHKFCRGYGIFQYDLQFFKTNADYFLNKKWASFPDCLSICVGELRSKLKKTYGAGKTSLTDAEKVYVCIAYNRGSANLSKGFKQGYFDGSKYYGEYIDQYLQLAKTV